MFLKCWKIFIYVQNLIDATFYYRNYNGKNSINSKIDIVIFLRRSAKTILVHCKTGAKLHSLVIIYIWIIVNLKHEESILGLSKIAQKFHPIQDGSSFLLCKKSYKIHSLNVHGLFFPEEKKEVNFELSKIWTNKSKGAE